MFAVLEFSDRKCSVVPLNWLTDNQKKCYWPKRVSSKQYEKMLESCTDPSPSWPLHEVIKIFQILDDHNAAISALDKIIAESTSSDNAGVENIQPLSNFGRDTFDDVLDDYGEDNNTPKSPERKRQRVEDDALESESSSEFSDDDRIDIAKIQKASADQSRLMLISKEKSSTITCNSPQSSASSSNPSVTPSSTLWTDSRTTTTGRSLSAPDSNALLITILKKVENINNTVEQQTLLLNNILTVNQSTSIMSLQRPSDIPNVPVENKSEYKRLEEFLRIEEKFNYMKCRLACIGGTGVRNAVMNMMKFILTDKVAQKFNWIGRDNKKKAFKETWMYKVIHEATMTAFSKHGDSATDLNDKVIQSAIKDWLKLAKLRLQNKLKKVK